MIEIYDIGPNPGAREIFVACLPKEKILVQAHLLNPDATVSFSERLAKLGLQVEKIYVVHGRRRAISWTLTYNRPYQYSSHASNSKA